MTGNAPFFVTSATLTTSTAADAKGSKKRKASASDGSLLRGSLEDLVASKREQTVALAVRVWMNSTARTACDWLQTASVLGDVCF